MNFCVLVIVICLPACRSRSGAGREFGVWNFPKPTLLVWRGEEGEDDAKSAWPSDVLGYTRGTIAATTRCDGETLSQSLEKRRQFGLRSATRPHEVGIASNRGSAIPR